MLNHFFWQESTSLAHPYLTILFHTSLQKCSRSIKLLGDLLCTAHFKSFHTFLKRFGALVGPFHEWSASKAIPLLSWICALGHYHAGMGIFLYTLSCLTGPSLCQNILAFINIHEFLNLDYRPSPGWREAAPKHVTWHYVTHELSYQCFPKVCSQYRLTRMNHF